MNFKAFIIAEKIPRPGYHVGDITDTDYTNLLITKGFLSDCACGAKMSWRNTIIVRPIQVGYVDVCDPSLSCRDCRQTVNVSHDWISDSYYKKLFGFFASKRLVDTFFIVLGWNLSQAGIAIPESLRPLKLSKYMEEQYKDFPFCSDPEIRDFNFYRAP